MKRFVKSATSAFMIIMLLVSFCGEAFAKEQTVGIYKVNVDGARVRMTPTSEEDNVETSLKKGTYVFVLGKVNQWIKICSEFGIIGYTFRDFLTFYGNVPVSSVYSVKKSVALKKNPKPKSSTSMYLKKNQLVVVYATQGDWAYVRTIAGKAGYVSLSSLKKAAK